ncbi:MAG: hypothetical protein E6K49_16370 [Gammaproteobacteria bacterium]|nr:MAG: hypothetical protein E6K49_16370 [Gammaproteobacteria bacterium]
MAIVLDLFVYPLKSARGIPSSRVRVTATGLEWDRHWMIVNGQLPHAHRTRPVSSARAASAGRCGGVGPRLGPWLHGARSGQGSRRVGERSHRAGSPPGACRSVHGAGRKPKVRRQDDGARSLPRRLPPACVQRGVARQSERAHAGTHPDGALPAEPGPHWTAGLR